MIGLDTNVPYDEVAAFEKRLASIPGVELGKSCPDQVTVAKQRTMFQTQTQKAGETDVSHKDYVLTGGWKRGNTQYYPDLCTQFGIERSTGYP